MAGNKNGRGKGNHNPRTKNTTLNENEIKQIENNAAKFANDPSSKDYHWAKIDERKIPAANKFYDELIRSGEYPGGPKDPNEAEVPWPSKPAATTEDSDTHHSGHVTQPQGIGAKIVAIGHVSSTSMDSEGDTPGAEASNEEAVMDGTSEADAAGSVGTNQPWEEISKTVSIPRAKLQDAPRIDFRETPTPSSAPSSSAPRGGRKAPVNPALPQRLSNQKGTSKYPLRTSLRGGPEKGEVITNHFQMNVNPNWVFYEYRITGIPASESRAGKKRYMETAIQNVPFLHNNRASLAYDNVDTIISWVRLHGEATAIGTELDLVDIIDRNTLARLRIQYSRRMTFDDLRSYANTLHANPFNYDPSTEENALNIIMSKCIVHDNTILHLNNHKFYVRDAFRDLGTSEVGAIAPLRSLRGYSYRVHATMGNLLLNISPANSAFWRPLLVSEVLEQGCGSFGGDIEDAKRALHNVRVYVIYDRDSTDKKCKHPKCRDRDNCTASNRANAPSLNDPYARLKTIRGFGMECNKQTFQWAHKDAQGNAIPAHRAEVTVQEYQSEQYKRTLRHPGLHAVNVGTNLTPTWFAPEDLRIVPDQIYAKIIPDAVATDFHRDACRSPTDIRSRIEREALPHIPITQAGTLAHCTQIRLIPHMIQIPSVRLPYPAISYRSTNKVVEQRSGRWNLTNAKFLQRKAANVSWKLITGPNVVPTGVSVRRVETHFNKALRQTGVALDCRMEGQPLNLPPKATEDNLRDTIRVYLQSRLDHQQSVPDIFVLLMHQKDQNLYSSFKHLADKVFVLQSICMVEAKTWGDGITQYMANIAMKANLKMTGINHSAQGLGTGLRDTLILGADCTHPGSGALAGSRSVAAVVGSLEANGGRFRGKLKLQLGKEEIIHGLGDFLVDHFIAWYDFHGKFPENVLYYRDGVSTSQYDDVVDVELAGIEEAFDNLVEAKKGVEVKPLKITAVIVTKRHSTRFFPRQQGDTMPGNGNCKPGLLVESAITSPYYTDFYLQSHNAIKGTARSAHYTVIRNDMGMSTNELEDLTHKLNYTYVRATMGVSYATPAYYADRLCERARCYLREFYSPDTNMRSDARNQLRIVEADVEQKRNTTNANVPPRPRGNKKTDTEIQAEKAHAKAVADGMYNWLNPILEKRWNAERDDVAKNAAGDERQARMLETMYWM